MKKVCLFFLVAIVMASIFSCSSPKEPEFMNAEMETAYVIPLNTHVEKDYSSRRIHMVVYGDNLSNLAQYYLGNSQLWGDFLVENEYLASEASYRGFQRPNGPGWLIYPGETILLPNYAFDRPHSRWLDSNQRITFDLSTEKLEQLKREVPIEKDPKNLYTKVGSSSPAVQVAESLANRNSSLDMPDWLVDLMWFLVAISMILVTAFIIYLIVNWLRANTIFVRSSTDRTNETESRSEGNTTIQGSFNTTEHHYHNENTFSTSLSVKLLKQVRKMLKENEGCKFYACIETDETFIEVQTLEDETIS